NNFIFNAGGVPEPATWAMMLTGFFGLGSMLRRRRAALAV
ncbi:MAG: PEPxxWA-CTERM sorting domain-containing protein, partial [Phenylobacterium sp.]